MTNTIRKNDELKNKQWQTEYEIMTNSTTNMSNTIIDNNDKQRE